MSNRATEIIVGFVTLVALTILIGVTVNLKKSTVFSRKYPLVAFFKDVKRLGEGAPVYVNGVVCGDVRKIEPAGNREYPVRVTLMVKEGIALHRGAQPQIVGAGLMGETEINIEDTSPTGPVLQPGDEMYGIPMMDINELLARAPAVVTDLQVAIAAISDILRDKKNRELFTSILESASSMTDQLSGLMGDLRTSAGPVLAQFRSAVSRVDKAVERADQTIGLAADILSENRQDAHRAIKHLTSSTVHLNQILARIDREGPLAEVIFGAKPYADFSRSLTEFKDAMETLRRWLEGLDRWLTGARSRGQPPVEIPYEGVTTGTAQTIK